ncbi:hypothetical protein [Streptomyces tendae]|uniref:hypothetical protein n=1 Tax=Streptomyces tendae TaxID=1932 RepID=UPI0037B8E1AD
MASFDGHHELRTEHTARADQALHAVDELGERAVVVGTVVPRAARPDRLALHAQGLALEEVVLNHVDTGMEFFELQPVDQAHRVGLAVTRKAYLASVQGERVAFDGDHVVAGGGQRQDELAVARADDRDGGVRGDTLAQCAEELGEESEGVLPQALGLHGSSLLACRFL